MIRRAVQKGFTLIELIVVIIILGILAAVAIPQFTNLADEARSAVATSACGAFMSSAVLLYASKKTSSTGAEIQANTTYSGLDSVTVAGCTISVTPKGGTPTACQAIPAPLCS